MANIINGDENFSDISEDNNYDDEDDQPRRRNQSNQLKSALPIIKFNKENYKNTGPENKDKLECSICFCEFEDNDKLRPL